MPKKRPCIRGLREFKKGCPEKYWDGSEGCPAWREYAIPTVEKGKPPRIIKDCIDCLSEHWQFEALKGLEGNQKTSESFRNGMCENINGKIYPKVGRGILEVMKVMQKQQDDITMLVTVIQKQQKDIHLLANDNNIMIEANDRKRIE